MIGAIVGDIIGSVYEWNNIKTKDFTLFSPDCKFTDDTVLTIALADAILTKRNYEDIMVEYANLYPKAGYGGLFRKWVADPNRLPYNSFGNGAAMRISPCAWAYDDLNTVLKKSKKFTEITHNHPQGIKYAQITAGCVF
jgi:ADP-ribosylglycohydrolase